MTNLFDDLMHFLERRLGDRQGDIPERENLHALAEWIDYGQPAPSITVTYHADGSVTVERPSQDRHGGR